MIFIGAADCEISCSLWSRLITLVEAVAMILRVWALYGRSKFILGALLTLYAIEIIPNLALCVWVGTHTGM